MTKFLTRKKRVLLVMSVCVSLISTILLWFICSRASSLLSYLPIPLASNFVVFFAVPPNNVLKTAAKSPRKARQLSFTDTSTLPLTLNDGEIDNNAIDQEQISSAENAPRQHQKYYWIVTHFRSGSTLLSTMFSIPQRDTIFLFEPLHFLQLPFIIALRDFYDSNPKYDRDTYNFTAMLAAVNVLHLSKASDTTATVGTVVSRSNSTFNKTSIDEYSLSLAADNSFPIEHNAALLRAVSHDTVDLRRLSTRLILDILQCRIVDSPEAHVYYLTDGFVNFDPNIAQLKARWRRENPKYYLQQVEQACRQAKRIVLKTIRADMRLVLDVVTTLRNLYQINVHVVHLWRHPMASINSAYGRTGVRPFVRWVRMFCHVLYAEDYMVFDIVRQQLNDNKFAPKRLHGVGSVNATKIYTRIFYEDLIMQQRRDPHTLSNLLTALGVEVTREHQEFIDSNFNSSCEPERPGAKRRDQGSFALCRTNTFDPHHWRERKNKAQLQEWMHACRPAIEFYEAEISYWQKNGKERPHGFYPV